jgi:hypothetical protein
MNTNTRTRAAVAFATAAVLASLAGCAGTATTADTSVEQGPAGQLARPDNLRQAIEADRPRQMLPSLPVPNLRQAIEADRRVQLLPSSPVPNLRQAIEADRGTGAGDVPPVSIRQLMEADH